MVNVSSPGRSVFDVPLWYCVHTKSKSEHLAAIHLAQVADEVEVFNPRLRFLKKTPRGRVWFTEALFPGYIFARFALGQSLRAVNHTACVLKVVSFGDRHPAVPDEIISLWRTKVDGNAVITVHEQLEKGDEVEIVDGPFRGIRTVITKVLPARERVKILLEVLGREREVELAVDDIRRADRNIRTAAAAAAAGNKA